MQSASSSAERQSTGKWDATIAFANLGITGPMVNNKRVWESRHESTVLSLLTNLMQDRDAQSRIIGVCLCEVGNLPEWLTDAGRERFDVMLRQLFKVLGQTRPPKILWSAPKHECVAAFYHDVDVERLEPLEKMNEVLTPFL